MQEVGVMTEPPSLASNLTERLKSEVKKVPASASVPVSFGRLLLQLLRRHLHKLLDDGVE